MRKKIKFSHKYSKLIRDSGNQICSAVLLDVFKIELADRSKQFLNYDTENGIYKLPQKGKYLMLLFKDEFTKLLFTTLRRDTVEKSLYYTNQIGETFELDIQEQTEVHK